MDFTKYSVLKDLLELAQKSDAIIEKAFSGVNIDDHFAYVKNKMRQLLNHSSTKCEKPAYVERLDVLPYKKINYSIEKFLNSKSHVHVRRSNIQSESSCVENHFQLDSKECDDSGIIFLSSSDTDENCSIQKRETGNENPITQNVNFVEKDESQKIVSDSGLIVLSNECNSKIASFQTDDCTPDARILNIKAGETYVCKAKKNMEFTPVNDNISLEPGCLLRDKRLTRSLKKYCKKMGISLDGSFEESTRLSHKVCFPDKTYLISSTSSEENIDCLILENNKTDLSLDYSESSLNPNRGKENIVSRNPKASGDILNPHPPNRKKLRLSVVLKDINHSCERKPKLAPNKCGEINYVNDKASGIGHFKKLPSHFQASKNKSSDFHSKKFSKTCNSQKNLNVTENDKKYEHFKRSEKLKFSSSTTSSDDSWLESIQKAKGLAVRNKEVSKENGSSYMKDKKITVVEKNHTSKEFKKHIETNSAPACKRRKLCKKNARPDTPLEFIINSNRRSLKDKAEEKRKQRELRAEKTKERRERLERERKEKLHMSEQKLKERFQQHEKMLKQKVGKFKIKLRNQYQESPKRSYTPTSSKNSIADMEEDNDGFCNVLDSGQKLSKKSNDYHEVSPKKVVLNSLEGNVGLDPEVSEKHNAILVSCEETPVKLLISTDTTEPKKEEMPAVSEDVIRPKDSEESEQQDSFHCQSCFEKFITNSSSKINNKSVQPVMCNSDKKRVPNDKRILVDMSANLIALETFESNTVTSNKMLHQKNLDKNASSHCLRSNKKCLPNDKLISTFTEDTGNNSKSFENSVDTVAPTPKKSEFSQSFFKSCKKKLKKLKNPSKSKIPRKNQTSAETRKKKHRPMDVNNKENIENEIFKEISDDEEQELISYKISDPLENSFEDSEIEPKKIPVWATSVHLRQALIKQYYNPINVEKIFGNISMEPVDLTSIFKVDKPEYHRRTSSEKWSVNTTV